MSTHTYIQIALTEVVVCVMLSHRGGILCWWSG